MAVNVPRRSHSHKISLIATKLLALGCPYVQSLEENLVGRVVLTSGEARTRVLCWLVERFQTNLPVQLLSTSLSMDTGTLTIHLSNMGVCSKDNIALVEGKTSLVQQLLFLESLLNLLETAESKESMSQLECSCRFADVLCCSENLDTNIFPCSLNLLPADVVHTTTQSRMVSAEQLSREAERLSTLVEDKQAELSTVMQQHQFEEVNSTIVQSCVKSLSVSVGTLAQLVTNFCQSYETELQPWVCDRHLSLGPLGPLCKRAASHWDHICKMLHSLEQLQVMLERLQINSESTSMYHPCQEQVGKCVDKMADLTLPDN